MRLVALCIIVISLSNVVGAMGAEDALTEAEAALARWDGEVAYRLAQSVHTERPGDPQVLALLTKASLYRGEYVEAGNWAGRWLETEPASDHAKGWKAFAEQTSWAVQGFKTYTSPHFVLQLEDERDGILAEYALTALENAYEFLGRDLGYRPKAPVRVESFPITSGFTPPRPCRSAISKSPAQWVFANSIR